jgi:hypothetical protein
MRILIRLTNDLSPAPYPSKAAPIAVFLPGSD